MLQVGKKAPEFDMPSTKDMKTLGQNVRLADYKGKYLILFFYPLDFTFVCPTELKAFNEKYDEIKKLEQKLSLFPLIVFSVIGLGSVLRKIRVGWDQ